MHTLSSPLDAINRLKSRRPPRIPTKADNCDSTTPASAAATTDNLAAPLKFKSRLPLPSKRQPNRQPPASSRAAPARNAISRKTRLSEPGSFRLDLSNSASTSKHSSFSTSTLGCNPFKAASEPINNPFTPDSTSGSHPKTKLLFQSSFASPLWTHRTEEEQAPKDGPTNPNDNATFSWNMALLRPHGYRYQWLPTETTSDRAAIFDSIEDHYGLHRGPSTARILMHEENRYVFLAEEGVFVTDTLEYERIALVSRDAWKSQQILSEVGIHGREGPWRAMGSVYDAEAENQEWDWYRYEEGWRSPVQYDSDWDDPSFW
ncbi:hypothetical protein BJ508DRAFT_309607 [Ascobolus immersus RN42]|uniref:Uncharacterized protein n=1 Tax=Ascobolus immersus RN42 TaxID=1160509 RepID=A0A3N4I882_ASCIM|nr:hypothetical protein BJ508DRAFT_309607 [Ascobolus immersus RN42]